MKYILDKKFKLRGWADKPTGLLSIEHDEPIFLPKDKYLLILKCDGAHEIDVDSLNPEEKQFLESGIKEGAVRPSGFMEFLRDDQAYKRYPAVYKHEAHWSVTGACNFKCRHCFMSAPHAKHGTPTHEQIIGIADQLAECGVMTASLTGGEPLIREDFFDIVDALTERGIKVTTIYTNGWLVDEVFLDKFEEKGLHPSFQISFDGVGKHDFLRGIPGAEEKAVKVLKLLQERKHGVSVSMCLHKDNCDVLRETVNLLASLGVKSMKVGNMMEIGEWASPEVAGLQLGEQEQLEAFEKYIPQYFEDNAPLSIMLGGAFIYSPGSEEWHIFYKREITAEKENSSPACGALLNVFYVGADGMIAPCMGMCDCGFSKELPNVFEKPLREILAPGEKLYTLCNATVAQVRDKSGKCRDCKYVDKCAGGCRNSALMADDNYYGVDPECCFFFENGWEERLTAAAQPAFEEYLKRCPPTKKKDKSEKKTIEDCP
jgi:radical SAM protein with 4Fe4S-binding SPASM domain